MNSVRGKLTLISQPNIGTVVTLTFMIDSKPIWYPEKICLSENNIVIILDDDVAMQILWQHRLQNYPVKIKLFTNYSDTVDWINQQKNLLEKMILLIDYELTEKSVDGLMLLKHFDVKNRGYLVTSHAEEINIQNEVEKMGIWLIPKTLACQTLIGLQSAIKDE